jgi:hypothetical protein
MNTSTAPLRMRSQPAETIFFHGYDVIVVRGPLRRATPDEPAALTAILMCYEETCDKMKVHRLVGRRLVATRKTGTPLYDEIVYSCSACGSHRVWGTEEVKAEKKHT